MSYYINIVCIFPCCFKKMNEKIMPTKIKCKDKPFMRWKKIGWEKRHSNLLKLFAFKEMVFESKNNPNIWLPILHNEYWPSDINVVDRQPSFSGYKINTYRYLSPLDLIIAGLHCMANTRQNVYLHYTMQRECMNK